MILMKRIVEQWNPEQRLWFVVNSPNLSVGTKFRLNGSLPGAEEFIVDKAPYLTRDNCQVSTYAIHCTKVQ